MTRIRRCLRLPHNDRGRDFVVGDLHGHRSLLEAELDRLGFDPARDRVFSVGDLIDRGPESLETLALIEEPWFHAVLGNHEMMLLNFLGHYDSRLHSRKAYPSGTGQWIGEALAGRRKRVRRLAERVAGLPLAIHVAGAAPFNVMHGDLHPLEARQETLFSEGTVCVHVADSSTSSRRKLAEAMKSPLTDLSFAQRTVQVSARPLGVLAPTYVGHSPLRHVTVHDSYVYIDQGVAARSASQVQARPPTVVDQRQFSYWLRGVALARDGAFAWGAPARPARAAVDERRLAVA